MLAWIFPLYGCPLTAGHLCPLPNPLLFKHPSCSLLPLCVSPQSGIPLTPARLESSWKGARKTPYLSVGRLAVGGDKPGPCHRDEVFFTQQGNQWGWTASKHPAAASWLIFISAHNPCILTLPAAVKCGSTDDSHLWMFGMEKGQLSAVSICTVSWQLFIVICALYQYSALNSR